MRELKRYTIVSCAVICVFALSTAQAVSSADLQLQVNYVTGEVSLVNTTAGSMNITGYQIDSGDLGLIGANHVPWMGGVVTSQDHLISEGNLTAQSVGTDQLLGLIYNASLDTRDLVYHWTDTSFEVYQGQIQYIPEPAALSLLGLVGLGLLARRRRAA